MIVSENFTHEISSTVEQLKEFFEGSLWKDLEEARVATIEEDRDALEVCADPLEAAYIRGRLSVLREMANTPQLMLEAKKLEIEGDAT